MDFLYRGLYSLVGDMQAAISKSKNTFIDIVTAFV